MPSAIATTATSVASVSSGPTWKASPSSCSPTTTAASWHAARRPSSSASRLAHPTISCASSCPESRLKHSHPTTSCMASLPHASWSSYATCRQCVSATPSTKPSPYSTASRPVSSSSGAHSSTTECCSR